MVCHYNYNDFLKACEKGVSAVFVYKSAKESAKKLCKLKTTQEILDLFCDGVQNLKHQNQKIWENNPDESLIIIADAYTFRARSMDLYFAFFFNPKTNIWSIKSFKKDVFSSSSSVMI